MCAQGSGFRVSGLGCSGLRSFPSACRHHLTDDVALFRFCSARGPQDSETTPATHGNVEQSGYILPSAAAHDNAHVYCCPETRVGMAPKP